MKHHPKYRVHQPGHPQRGESTRRPQSLGRAIEQQIRSSMNARQRKGEGPRGRVTTRRGRS
jgi:hypothetical protein